MLLSSSCWYFHHDNVNIQTFRLKIFQIFTSVEEKNFPEINDYFHLIFLFIFSFMMIIIYWRSSFIPHLHFNGNFYHLHLIVFLILYLIFTWNFVSEYFQFTDTKFNWKMQISPCCIINQSEKFWKVKPENLLLMLPWPRSVHRFHVRLIQLSWIILTSLLM